jgi:Family of unknown function (DUF5681)
MPRGGLRSTSFKKGQSGNPKGRPKDAVDVRTLARVHTGEAVERLVHWLRSDNPKASVAAAAILLDRGWGRVAPDIQVIQNEITLVDVIQESYKPRVIVEGAAHAQLEGPRDGADAIAAELSGKAEDDD